jgi:predicted esterase
MMKKLVYTDKSIRELTMFTIFIIWALLVLSACSSDLNVPDTAVVYKEIKIERCDADTLNIYHILVPETVATDQKIPLVIVLDAHGSGALAVHNFHSAVRNFPCLVAGSDLIKNNYPDFENAILQLISDVEQKYPVDEQKIILAGFSGGARMALYFSVKYRVKGLIMCGAGPGQQTPPCPVYMIAGMGDFNFAEQYIRPEITSFNEDQKISTFFHGVHEWPGSEQLADALLFLLCNSENMGKLRQARSRELLHVSDSLEKAGDQLMAWQSLEKAAKIAEDNSVRKRAVNEGNKLLKNDDFRKAIRSLEEDLKSEQKIQQAYMQDLITKDLSWWKNELTLLNKKVKTNSGGIEADHYLRIKGFIGILFYSRINSLINSDPKNPQLKTMLESYAFAEPENPDPYYFMALYAQFNGDHEACVENANKAIKLGFSDQEKLKKIAF